jgi:hypothetical protein
MHTGAMAFIYDPKRVARLLKCLPSLAARLPSPEEEGRAAEAFTGQRITDRALYRLLANPQYPHLREALRAIEAAAASAMSLKELREAKLRGEFGSLLAEVLLADHFLSRGLAVSKRSPRVGKNPDLEVAAEGFTATVEVYSPRSWHWREDWLDDVRDALKNADIPYAFAATVDIVVTGLPMHADLLEDMILCTGQDVLRRVQADLASLDESAADAVWRYEHEGGEITTTVEFTHVEPETGGLVRMIGIGGPGDAFGVSVEFTALIAKIREKAEKRQAVRGAGEIRGLAVDVSRTKLDYFLETGRLTFDASSGLDLDPLDLDFVALTVPRRGKSGPCRGVRAAVLFEDTRITREQVGQLFDIAPPGSRS